MFTSHKEYRITLIGLTYTNCLVNKQYIEENGRIFFSGTL